MDTTETKGLPVAGYKPTQPQWAIDAVNGFKELEERTLRAIDRAAEQDIDPRFLAIGRTQLQQAFMAINRAIFQPGRVALPEDSTGDLFVDGHGDVSEGAWPNNAEQG